MREGGREEWWPAGKRILLGCFTGEMALLDTETAREAARFTGPVWAAAFPADGKFVASSNNDNKVRLFTVP